MLSGAFAAPVSGAPSGYILEVPDDLTISGISGDASTVVELPAGATPTSFTGRVSSTYTLPGDLIVTVNSRELAKVDALTGGSVSGPLTADDLRDGALRLGFKVSTVGDDRCFDQSGVSAVLDQIAITYQAPSTAPRTVADFMVGAPRSVTVSVPPGSSSAVHEAALNTVAVMAKTFARPTAVTLAIQAPAPANPNLDRVVAVSEGGDPKVAVVDGVLVISGPAESLTTSAQALASSNVAILGEPVAGGPSASVGDVIPALTSSLVDLGKGSPQLAGVGIVEASFGVSQSDFGRPVRAMTLTLTGTSTPVQGGEGRVNVLWNDELIESVPLTDESTFNVSMAVTGAKIRRDNSVTLQLEYLPRGGECSLAELPARLDIDGEASTISATAGRSATGFDMFPQALTSSTPVAFGSAQSADDSVVQAGQILAGLQRLSSREIKVSLLDWAEFVADPRPGLAVGVGPGEDTEIATPLRYAPFRTVDVDDNTLTAEVAGSFAAFQAYLAGERALLALGGVGADAPAQADLLAVVSNENPAGWFNLVGSIAVAQPDRATVFLAPESISAQPEQTGASSLRSFRWLWWIAALMLAGLVAGVLLRLRARRS